MDFQKVNCTEHNYKSVINILKCCRKCTFGYGTYLLNILNYKILFKVRGIDCQSYLSLCDEPFFGKFQDTSL